MRTKRIDPQEKIHLRFLKHKDPLPQNYWFEIYRKGESRYLMIRWGWSEGGNRGSRNLGKLEIVVPYLIDNLDLLGQEGRKSLSKIVSSHQPHLHQGFVEQIEQLRQREVQANKGAQLLPRWEGGCLLQYIDWEMIEKSVFG